MEDLGNGFFGGGGGGGGGLRGILQEDEINLRSEPCRQILVVACVSKRELVVSDANVDERVAREK